MSRPSDARRRLRLRRADTCCSCGAALVAGVEAFWSRADRTVWCVGCNASGVAATPVVSGVPGASARREHQRRRTRREERVRAAHPRIGGLILALGSEPQSTRSWEVGARGEEAVGAALDERAGARLRVLHDRRMPASRGNIDHVVVTGNGVWVVDPKAYKGRPTLRVDGGIVRARRERLFVDGRDRSTLVTGLRRQLDVVREVVGPEVPVRGALCFVGADWPLIGGDFVVDGVAVLWPRRLYPRLEADGPLSDEQVEDVWLRLGQALAPA